MKKKNNNKIKNKKLKGMQKLMKSGPGDSPRAGSGASKDAGDFGVQASEQNNAEIEYLRRAQVFFFFFKLCILFFCEYHLY